VRAAIRRATKVSAALARIRDARPYGGGNGNFRPCRPLGSCLVAGVADWSRPQCAAKHPAPRRADLPGRGAPTARPGDSLTGLSVVSEPDGPRVRAALFRVRGLRACRWGRRSRGTVAGEAHCILPRWQSTGPSGRIVRRRAHRWADSLRYSGALHYAGETNGHPSTPGAFVRRPGGGVPAPLRRLDPVAPTFGRPPDSAARGQNETRGDRADRGGPWRARDTASLDEAVPPPTRLPHNERIRRRSGIQRHRHVDATRALDFAGTTTAHRCAAAQPRRGPHRLPVLSRWKRDSISITAAGLTRAYPAPFPASSWRRVTRSRG
jgi:hypothetical protein